MIVMPITTTAYCNCVNENGRIVRRGVEARQNYYLLKAFEVLLGRQKLAEQEMGDCVSWELDPQVD